MVYFILFPFVARSFGLWIVELLVLVENDEQHFFIDGNAVTHVLTGKKVPHAFQAVMDDELFKYVENNVDKWIEDTTPLTIATEQEIEEPDYTEWEYETPRAAAEAGLPVPSWQLR